MLVSEKMEIQKRCRMLKKDERYEAYKEVLENIEDMQNIKDKMNIRDYYLDRMEKLLEAKRLIKGYMIENLNDETLELILKNKGWY